MSRKTRKPLVFSCLAIIFCGLFFWKDYSRGSFERKVEAAVRTNDVPTLAKALESKDERLRRKAAIAIPRIDVDTSSTVPALIEALSMEDTSFIHSTHVSIIKAIGSIGPDAQNAVPHLMKLLGQADPSDHTDSRASATVEALGQIGPAASDAIPMLLDRLNRQSVTGRPATLQALAKIGPNSSDVVAALMNFIQENALLAGPVVNALEKMGPEATESVRAYTEEIFDDVADGGGSFRLKKAGDATFFIPIEAQGKLESLGELAAPFLHAGLNDDREPVRVVSAFVLVDRGENSSEVVSVLSAALDSPQYRRGAIDALRKMGPSAQAALPTLRSLAVDAGDDSPYASMLHEAIHAIEAGRRPE